MEESIFGVKSAENSNLNKRSNRNNSTPRHIVKILRAVHYFSRHYNSGIIHEGGLMNIQMILLCSMFFFLVANTTLGENCRYVKKIFRFKINMM